MVKFNEIITSLISGIDVWAMTLDCYAGALGSNADESYQRH